MLAVVLCLNGGRAKFAADFLRGRDCHPEIALGPGNILATMRDLASKRLGPIRVVTDSIRCLEVVRGSSAYAQTEIIFCGDDPERMAGRTATVCLSPDSSLIELEHALRRLAQGLPYRSGDQGGSSRLRRD